MFLDYFFSLEGALKRKRGRRLWEGREGEEEGTDREKKRPLC